MTESRSNAPMRRWQSRTYEEASLQPQVRAATPRTHLAVVLDRDNHAERALMRTLSACFKGYLDVELLSADGRLVSVKLYPGAALELRR
jgi:hypothetical protein